MIYYGCPNCGAPMQSPDSMAGQKEKCPECGNVTIVPKPQQATPPPAGHSRGDTSSRETPAAAPAQPAAPAPAPQVIITTPTVKAGKSASGLGIAGLVLGILGCIVAWIPVIGCVG